MLFVDFDQAWQVYLDAGARLPSPPPTVAPRPVSGLAEALTHGVDLVVFDAYGVLHEGDQAYGGVADAIAALREAKIPLCVVTNDVTHEAHHVAAGLQKRGLDIAADEVISGRSLLPQMVEQVMTPGQIFGLHATYPEPLLQRWPTLRPLGDDAAAYQGLDGVILVDTNSWEERHAEVFLQAMQNHPVPLVVCNPDVGCPFKGRVSAEPGYFAHQAAQQAHVATHFMGKPFPSIYHKVLERFPQVSVERMLMVGDSPHTDILGGRGIGMRCLLITEGFLKGQDPFQRFAQSGLWPDFMSSSIG